MTLVISEGLEKDDVAFGGRKLWANIVYFGVDTVIDYLEGETGFTDTRKKDVWYKQTYAKTLSRKTKYGRKTGYSELQTDYRRRSCKSGSRNKYCSRYSRGRRQLFGTNRVKQRGAYRGSSKIRKYFRKF